MALARHSLLLRLVLACGATCACSRTPVRHLAPQSPARPAGPPLSAQAQETLLHKTEAAWLQRDDPVALAGLIADLELLWAQAPQDGDRAARLSHAYFLQARAQRRQGMRAQMLDSLSRGVVVGEQALAALYPAMQDTLAQPDPITAHLGDVDSRGMDALTWYVSNLGAYAASRGMTSLIFYRDRVTAILERMLVVDASFAYSTPHRYWAIYLARAPAFAGGNLEQARVHFEKARKNHPDYFANACDYAQFYAVPKGDRALFTQLLTGVLEQDANRLAETAPEMRLEKLRAQELMDRVENLF